MLGLFVLIGLLFVILFYLGLFYVVKGAIKEALTELKKSNNCEE